MDRTDRIMAEAILKIAVIKDHERELAELENDNSEVHFSKEHDRRMRKMFNKARIRRTTLKVWRVAYKSAAVFLIAFALFSSVLMFNGDVRAAVLNVFVQWFDTHTRFEYSDEPTDPLNTEWSLGYIPDGYFKTYGMFELGMTEMRYENSNGDSIYFSTYPLGGTSSVDNNNSEYRDIVYNGIEYSIFESSDSKFPNVTLWTGESHTFMLQSFLPSETMLKTADSVEKIKK